MIVEERIYTLHPGKAAEWLKAYQEEGMAIQTRHQGQPLGYFFTEFGPLNQVIHLWGYDSLEDRARRRAAAAKDPEWQAYLVKIRPLLISQENKLLMPAPFSPIGGSKA